MFIPTAPAEEIRQANRLVHRSPTMPSNVTAASIFALWILIPLALGGFAFVLLGIWNLKSDFDLYGVFDVRVWLALTLLLQAGYWMMLAKSAGLSVQRGLWALVPVVALVPTFSLARSAARTKA